MLTFVLRVLPGERWLLLSDEDRAKYEAMADEDAKRSLRAAEAADDAAARDDDNAAAEPDDDAAEPSIDEA